MIKWFESWCTVRPSFMPVRRSGTSVNKCACEFHVSVWVPRSLLQCYCPLDRCRQGLATISCLIDRLTDCSVSDFTVCHGWYLVTCSQWVPTHQLDNLGLAFAGHHSKPRRPRKYSQPINLKTANWRSALPNCEIPRRQHYVLSERACSGLCVTMR